MPKRSGQRPFEAVFRNLVPDLTRPDPEGWSVGTCPYCQEAQSFRANVVTGKWLCLPNPRGQVPERATASPTAPEELIGRAESQETERAELPEDDLRAELEAAEHGTPHGEPVGKTGEE